MSLNPHTTASLNHQLDHKLRRGSFRQLVDANQLVDFASNDFLGFSRSPQLKEMILHKYKDDPGLFVGSGGSRLLAGNSSYVEATERYIATFHQAASGLLFNSGYDANIGLFSCVPGDRDLVLHDALIHASIWDGLKMSTAKSLPFKHNSIEDLERLILENRTSETKNIYVVVESIYSMDGDFSPLQDVAAICEKYAANLIVDEAFGTGLFGHKGKGRVVELDLTDKVFARIHTFGKALGAQGAIVLGDPVLKKYLINFARSFIYTTALPATSLVAINCAYDLLEQSNAIINDLHEKIEFFRSEMAVRRNGKENDIFSVESFSPVQPIIIQGNENVVRFADEIREAGYDVRPVRSPTVPKNTERLRVCLHAHNSREEIVELVNLLAPV